MSKEIKTSDLRELRRIQESIPEEWKKSITVERKVTPNLSRDLRKIVKSPELSEDKRRKIQTLIDTGVFDKTEQVENKAVAKKISEYLSRKQAEAIKAGRLTKRKHEK